MKKIKKGFSLIEVIVAITVLAVGVLGVAGFFAISSGLTKTASNSSIASNLAQGYIDHELSLSYDALTPGTSTAIKASNDPTNPLNKFSEQITISYIDQNLNQSATDLGMKKIQVIVSYTEGNKNKNVTLSSIQAKK